MDYAATTMSASGGYGESTNKSDSATTPAANQAANSEQNSKGGPNSSLAPGMIMQESGSDSSTISLVMKMPWEHTT